MELLIILFTLMISWILVEAKAFMEDMAKPMTYFLLPYKPLWLAKNEKHLLLQKHSEKLPMQISIIINDPML
jgi:hypothetical protein